MIEKRALRKAVSGWVVRKKVKEKEVWGGRGGKKPLS